MKTKNLILLVLIIGLSFPVFAHPPKKLELKYNKELGKLEMNIVHPVKDVNDHFIKSITISVNDKEVKVLEFTSQSSAEAQKTEYELADLLIGTRVRVSASCNKFGIKAATIKIE